MTKEQISELLEMIDITRPAEAVDLIMVACGLRNPHPLIHAMLHAAWRAICREQQFKELRKLKLREIDPAIWERENDLEAEHDAKRYKTEAASYALFSRNIEDIVDRHADSIYSRWMINGLIPLGDATREQLLEAANNEKLSASGHLKTAQFYLELAEHIEPNKRLHECLSVKNTELIRYRIFVANAQKHAPVHPTDQEITA